VGWRERLKQLVLAGGSLAMSNCTGCCNANPDPCCSAPKSQACAEWNACTADGGFIDWVAVDGAYVEKCVRPGDDLAVPGNAALDLAKPGDGSSHD